MTPRVRVTVMEGIMTRNSKLREINRTAKRYIILAAPTKEIAEELLKWWKN